MNPSQIAKNILNIPGVVGIGYSEPKIFVESPGYVEAMPRVLYGKKVDVIVTGKIKALGVRNYTRPIVGGISISNDWMEGTLGIVSNGLIISNAHVIAMNDNGEFVKSAKIYQPGILDSGGEKNVVGMLKWYVPIKFNSVLVTNEVDLATAIPTVDVVEDSIMVGDEIKKIDLSPAFLREGDRVYKVGRTSGLTFGKVISTHASIKVYYGNKWAVFDDVVVAKGEGEPFMKEGDSGSVWVKGNKFAGLGFAGNPDTGYAFAARAAHVIDALGRKSTMVKYFVAGMGALFMGTIAYNLLSRRSRGTTF